MTNQKTRNVGPHKLIPKKNRNKKKSRLENKKFRSVIKSLYGISADHNNINGLKHLLHKSEDKNKYPLMDISKSILIVFWKITMKQSDIISNILIPSPLPYSEFSHRFELNTDSPNMVVI